MAYFIIGTYERFLLGYTFAPTKAAFTQTFAVPSHTLSVRSVACEGEILVAGGNDGGIKIYNTKKLKEIGSILYHEEAVNCICFQKKWMLSGSGKEIVIWERDGWEQVGTLVGHKGRVNSIAVHHTGKLAVSVAADKVLNVWDLHKVKLAAVRKLNYEGEQILFNKAGSNYTISSAIGVTTYDMSGDELARYEFTGRVQNITIFLLSKKEYLAVGDGEGCLCLYEVGNATLISKHKLHDIRIKGLFISTEGKSPVCLTTASDGKVRAWDASQLLNSDRLPIAPLAEATTTARPTCATGYRI